MSKIFEELEAKVREQIRGHEYDTVALAGEQLLDMVRGARKAARHGRAGADRVQIRLRAGSDGSRPPAGGLRAGAGRPAGDGRKAPGRRRGAGG